MGLEKKKVIHVILFLPFVVCVWGCVLGKLIIECEGIR